MSHSHRATTLRLKYVARTGRQWNAVPEEYGSGNTANRYFLRWVPAGVFRRMWQAGLTECDEVKGIAWKWPSADRALTKAPLGGERTGSISTDRGKSGTKRSLWVGERGVPSAIVVNGANTPDQSLLAETLAERQAEAPADMTENLCLDKGYTGEPVEKIAQAHDLELHVPIKTNAKKRKRRPGRRKAWRWIVDVAHPWINRFCRLLVR